MTFLAKRGREKTTFLAGKSLFPQLPENNLANAWNRMSLLFLLREKKAERINKNTFLVPEGFLYNLHADTSPCNWLEWAVHICPYASSGHNVHPLTGTC